MFEFCNKMYINNLNAFIKIEINDQNSVFDKSCIAQNEGVTLFCHCRICIIP